MPAPIWDSDLQTTKECFDYRSKWACFDCRNSFVRVRDNDNEVICPNCAKSAVDMGYLFEPPAKRNKKLWAVMEVLGNNGIRYSKVGNVAYINYMITDHNKLGLKEVKANVAYSLVKTEQARLAGILVVA